jgi:hypothetical protein
MALLEIEDLQTHFRTRDGVNRAVDGISFHVNEARRLCGRQRLREIRHRNVDSAPRSGTAGESQLDPLQGEEL